MNIRLNSFTFIRTQDLFIEAEIQKFRKTDRTNSIMFREEWFFFLLIKLKARTEQSLINGRRLFEVYTRLDSTSNKINVGFFSDEKIRNSKLVITVKTLVKA